MKLSFCVKKWQGLSSGLSCQSDWISWSNNAVHNWDSPQPKPINIPMMQARRMSTPSRLAVEVGLKLIEDTEIDFGIFISRHGELERTYNILKALNLNNQVSPTDFALSVHNTASGLLTIIAKRAIPITSISANKDGFHQGLIEAYSLIKNGNEQILLIDFDGNIPDVYEEQISSSVPAYAVGLILSGGEQINAEAVFDEVPCYQKQYPQSLAFLHAYLSKHQTFSLHGNFCNWRWTLNN